MSTDWYYQADGKDVGPISSSALRQLAGSGIVSPETAVRRSCDSTWTAAKHVRGLLPHQEALDESLPSRQGPPIRGADDSDVVAWLSDNSRGIGVGPVSPDWGPTVVDKYRVDYVKAMHAIDNDVGRLVQDGKEMRALVLLEETVRKIVEIHGALASFYAVLWKNLAILERCGSQRLRQFDHRPLPIRALLTDGPATEDEIEEIVLNALRGHGICKKHWLLKEVMVGEIEYMLDALRILIEPDFIPGP